MLAPRELFELGYGFGEVAIDFNLAMLFAAVDGTPPGPSPGLLERMQALFAELNQGHQATRKRLERVHEQATQLGIQVPAIPRTSQEFFEFSERTTAAIYAALEPYPQQLSTFAIGFRNGDVLATLAMLEALSRLLAVDPANAVLVENFRANRDSLPRALAAQGIANRQPHLSAASQRALHEAYVPTALLERDLSLPESGEAALAISRRILAAIEELRNGVTAALPLF